jgi:hypothetical protein
MMMMMMRMMRMRGRRTTARIIPTDNRTMSYLMRTTYSELLPAQRKLYQVADRF